MPPVRSERQQATVDALLDAALAHLRDRGADGLTVRAVAERAGVTHTTGYAYFGSRDHLVASLFRRQVRAADDDAPPPDPRDPVGRRVAAAVAGPSQVATADPALARAGLVSLLADEPAVAAVRDELGADVVDRLRAALGAQAAPPVVEALALAHTGAMLQASMGYLPFAAVGDRLATLAEALVPDG